MGEGGGERGREENGMEGGEKGEILALGPGFFSSRSIFNLCQNPKRDFFFVSKNFFTVFTVFIKRFFLKSLVWSITSDSEFDKMNLKKNFLLENSSDLNLEFWNFRNFLNFEKVEKNFSNSEMQKFFSNFKLHVDFHFAREFPIQIEIRKLHTNRERDKHEFEYELQLEFEIQTCEICVQ